MRNLHRFSVLLSGTVAVVAVCAMPAPARAQFSIPGVPQVVLDPRNLVQNAKRVAQGAQQIDLARRQVMYQIQSLQKLSHPNWRDISALVDQYDALMRQGQALGYSAANLDQQFRTYFPGYSVPAGMVASEAQRVQGTRALETFRAALNATQRQMQGMRPDLMRLQRIKAQMQTIRGTQEGIEMQNVLQGYVAEELMMLRQSVATQTNALAVANAQRVQREMQEQVVLDQLLRNTLNRPHVASPGLDGHWGREP